MFWVGCSLLFFYSSSSSPIVVLADGSTSNVGGVGLSNATPFFSLESLPLGLYMPKILFNICVCRLTRSFNCSVIFFLDYCVFQELGTETMIDAGHEYGGPYHLDIDSILVASSSDVFPPDLHCSLSHRFLESSKEISSELSHVSTLERESCRLGKKHHDLST